MKNEKHEYAFFSTPKGLNLLIPPENLHEICVEHNLEIAGRYTDSWVIKQRNFEYFRKKIKTGLSLEQCETLLGELDDFRVECFKTGGGIDLGVEIDGQQNTVIQEAYRRLEDFSEEIIPKIDGFIHFMQKQIEKCKKQKVEDIELSKKFAERSPSTFGSVDDPTYRQVALFYYYCQKCDPKIIQPFNEWGSTLRNVYTQVCEKWKLKSWKHFERCFLDIGTDLDRSTYMQKEYNRKIVFELLKDYPEALKFAMDELNTNQSKKHKKL